MAAGICRQMRMLKPRKYLTFIREASFKSQSKVSVGEYVLLTVPITTFCLGCWQVKRRTWKLNLIEEVKKQNEAPPQELPEDLDNLTTMEYRRVHVRGSFDHSKEMYIGPRQLMREDDAGGSLMSSRSQSGNLVITPFHVTDRNITILVNRGWVPRDKTDPSKRPEGQIADEIDLIGTVRLHEKRPQFCPKSKSNSNHFYYRDVLSMAKICGTAPVYIDADAGSSVPGGPIGGQTRIQFRNEHMSYIITWYSLSAATLFMWYKKFLSPKLVL